MVVLHVVGARPQMMKLAPVWNALSNKKLEQYWYHTGQHSDEMLNAQFVTELFLPMPTKQMSVDLKADNETRIDSMTRGLVEVLAPWKHAVVLVYGDTLSTLAGARAAIELGFVLVHVEAGLRSGNFSMPEESIRIEVDRLADVHWCPSKAALDSLIQEDVVKDTARSVVVGDVMLDVFREYEPLPHRDRGGMVVTIHRNTNVDDAANRKLWLDAVCRLAEDRVVIWPMHHRWWSVATSEERNQLRGSKVRLANPVGHEQMLKWCASAAVVVTDSGGLQKESYMLGTPVAILRKETEWQELLVSDGVELFDPLEPGVADRLVKWVEERERLPSNFPPVYGEGNAAKAMADHFVALWPKS